MYEKNLGDRAVLTLEGEYKTFDSNLTTVALAAPSCFCLFSGDASMLTALYLFKGKAGIGKPQPYIRYTKNKPDDSVNRDELEIGVNYIIDSHNARLSAFYQKGDIATKDLNYTPSAAGNGVNAFKAALQLQF